MVPVYMPDLSIYVHVAFIGRAFTLFKHRPYTGKYNLWPRCMRDLYLELHSQHSDHEWSHLGVEGQHGTQKC